MDLKKNIEEANQKAIDIIVNGQPTWVRVMRVSEFVANFPENMILHAGPPMDPKHASTPFKNAVGGAAVHEGLADTIEDAWKMVLAGDILLGSQLDYRGASGAAYAVSASTPVQICENTLTGTQCFCTFQEGPSTQVLRWGIYNSQVEERFVWFDEVLAPALDEAVVLMKGLNIRNILAKASAMGDENHSRQVASTALLIQQLMPAIMDLNLSERKRIEVVKFLCSAERFFLHIFIAGAASVMEAVKGIEYCTILCGQGGNGYEFGTKFAFSGNDWYTDECPACKGLYLNPEWTDAQAVGYLGDSCVVETYGFGGNSAVAGPMVVRLTGGDLEEAIRRTENARQICVGTLDWASIPMLDFQGPPVGIDMRKVVSTGITPVIHGGMHHVNGGQAGAGSTQVPLACFIKGVRAFAKKYSL